ncbi:hypothetical protein Taro_008974 [Colocasia esculenta]|uniref:Uncharacterized protein n=1 Tax=Colocasia esculenta TaxID=4460 RepID=A0A843U525_COLES|nr:hypothetical protein [Colocasia esculenta]
MGFAACCGAIPALEASPAGAGGARRLFLSRIHTNNAWVAAASSVGSKGVDIFYGTRSYAAKGSGRRFLTSANAESNKRPSKLVETPLEPESPAGKFLCGVMNDHPHIFLVAAAQQLEDLALERDNAVARRDCSSGSAESHLHE